jgi:hypothetical protein
MPLMTIFEQLLQPVMLEDGPRWEDGRMLVAQEKETSKLIRSLIDELSERHAASCPDGPAGVAGSELGERDELGLGITGLLRSPVAGSTTSASMSLTSASSQP